MKSAIVTMQEILEHGKSVADDSPKHVGELSAGDYVAQGDVMIWKLDCVPQRAREVEPVAQLAPGTTKGSRHCVRQSDLPQCRFLQLPNANELQGPIIEAKKPFTIEHPEHGDQTFPSGIWFVTYQRAHAQELRRVQD